MDCTQTKLQKLLRAGWILTGHNTVLSPCGQAEFDNIDRAYFAWNAKLNMQRKIDRRASRNFLLTPLTRPKFYSRLFS